MRLRRLVALTLTLVVPVAAAHPSAGLSRQSEASLAASADVPAAALVALSEGGRFVVQSVDASTGVVVVAVSSAAEAASFVVRLSADAIRAAGLRAGAVLSVTAVASGWLLMAGSEAIAFIADAAVQPHVHSRRIHP